VVPRPGALSISSVPPRGAPSPLCWHGQAPGPSLRRHETDSVVAHRHSHAAVRPGDRETHLSRGNAGPHCGAPPGRCGRGRPPRRGQLRGRLERRQSSGIDSLRANCSHSTFSALVQPRSSAPRDGAGRRGRARHRSDAKDPNASSAGSLSAEGESDRSTRAASMERRASRWLRSSWSSLASRRLSSSCAVRRRCEPAGLFLGDSAPGTIQKECADEGRL
jgi:hypothetical protein